MPEVKDELASARALIEDLRKTARQIEDLEVKIETTAERLRELRSQKKQLLSYMVEHSAEDTPMLPGMGKGKNTPKKSAKKKRAKKAAKKKAGKKRATKKAKKVAKKSAKKKAAAK